MKRTLAALLALQCALPATFAWGAHGHRLITYVAIDSLPGDFPNWFSESKVRDRIAYQSNEIDRWKGWKHGTLNHTNYANHFLDVELLEDFGLTIHTMPRLRGDFIRAMAKADPDGKKKEPGFALQAVDEAYAKLQSSFNTLRILEQLNDSRRAHQLAQARENAVYHMGILSHIVGDLAQPLHTTKHYNGWQGENPRGFAAAGRDQTIHAFMDTGALDLHKIDYATVRAAKAPAIKLDGDGKDIWTDLRAYVLRSHAKFETVYEMDKDGTLRKSPGRALVTDRLADGAAMLAALYNGAWTSSVPTEQQISDFTRYNELDGDLARSSGQRGAATTVK